MCGILERRDPELRGHESIEDAQQKPVNERAEFESERVGWDRIDTVQLLTTTTLHSLTTHYYSLLYSLLLSFVTHVFSLFFKGTFVTEYPRFLGWVSTVWGAR